MHFSFQISAHQLLVYISMILSLISVDFVFGQRSVNGRNIFSKFFSPVRDLVCSGRATRQQLDRIYACRADFRNAIQYRTTSPDFESRLRNCINMIPANQLGFEVQDQHKDLVYAICLPAFRQCFFRAPGSKIVRPPVARAVFQSSVSTMIQCQKTIVDSAEANSTSSAPSSSSSFEIGSSSSSFQLDSSLSV